MGCFDVACALTSVPIRYKERCYMVVLSKDTDPARGVHLDPKYDIDACFVGNYDDYGSLDLGALDLNGKPVPNEYFEGLREWRNPETHRKFFFICEEVWSWCQEKYKALSCLDNYYPIRILEMYENTVKDNPKLASAAEHNRQFMKEELEDNRWRDQIYRVLLTFQQCHRNPLAGYQNGSQMYALADYTDVIEINTLSTSILEKWIQKRRDEGYFE